MRPELGVVGCMASCAGDVRVWAQPGVFAYISSAPFRALLEYLGLVGFAKKRCGDLEDVCCITASRPRCEARECKVGTSLRSEWLKTGRRALRAQDDNSKSSGANNRPLFCWEGVCILGAGVHTPP